MTPSWPRHAEAVDAAVDHDRQRRRRAALAEHLPRLPARLGDADRHRNLFLLTDDDAPDTDTEGTT